MLKKILRSHRFAFFRFWRRFCHLHLFDVTN